MIPVQCRVRHDPDAGSYGDCLRACVASILEMDANDVPHFNEGNADALQSRQRLIDFLAPRNLYPFYIGVDGRESRESVMASIGEVNPGCHYLLCGETRESGHIVVCKDDKVVHDPAWFPSPMTGPINGFWVIVLLVRK